jgi:CheY-like chemotaxis protein
MSLIVLTVDDSSDDTLLLQRACHRAGVKFSLQAVDDGTKAIAYLSGLEGFSDRTRHPIPDLILLDLKMPVKTGFEVLDWLRNHPEFESVPVAVLTASHHEADVRQAYRKGAKCFLTKPIEYDDLVKLAQALDKDLENEQSFPDLLRSLDAYKPEPPATSV